MMKFRRVFAIGLMFPLLVTSFHISAEAIEQVEANSPNWTVPFDYLALGDSLAAGIDYNGELGKGYTDELAQNINIMNALKSFNKGFATSGYTSTNVLTEIHENVMRDIAGVGMDGNVVRLREAIAAAEVITISAGANDLLAHVQVDTTTGEIAFNHEELTTAFHQIASNYKEILGQISEINPKAKVYVMGYYNPYPHLPEALQPQLEQLLQQLNHSIEVGIEGTSAIFVPTAEQIAEDYLTYLPNPQNIHLSKAGYKVVANQFYQSLVESYDGDPEGPLVLTDITGNRFESYINQAVASGLIQRGIQMGRLSQIIR